MLRQLSGLYQRYIGLYITYYMLVYIQPLFTRLLISVLSIVIDRSTRFQNNGDLEGILKRAET